MLKIFIDKFFIFEIKKIIISYLFREFILLYFHLEIYLQSFDKLVILILYINSLSIYSLKFMINGYIYIAIYYLFINIKPIISVNLLSLILIILLIIFNFNIILNHKINRYLNNYN